MLQRGHSDDGCDLASTLCMYDLRKGNLFVLRWARGAMSEAGSISSELLMCGGIVCSILLLPLVASCLETIYVCILVIYVFMSVVVTVLGIVGSFCVAAIAKDNGFVSIGVLIYCVCLCKGCDGCYVFCLYCDAWCCRCSCMGSMSVSSCRCWMFVSCVHPVA